MRAEQSPSEQVGGGDGEGTAAHIENSKGGRVLRVKFSSLPKQHIRTKHGDIPPEDAQH